MRQAAGPSPASTARFQARPRTGTAGRRALYRGREELFVPPLEYLDGVTPGTFLGALHGVTSRFKGNRWDYRVSADYRPSPEMLVYGTVSTGYNAGGVGPRPFNVAQAPWRNADKDLSVSLEVTNLFDKYYFVSKLDLTGAGAGSITGQPSRPREWAVTVKKNF